ncbi:hypothetical protein CEXT_554041 [Caerostris extrusa]|uniref:Uncharacterized protein n=1 Tax=Caerostris extrusa TaxID=172846 RepID=A0AAV4P897_CAEEX|nr:hypothetical protein CEXT_554041 [Caerostris extrusa]
MLKKCAKQIVAQNGVGALRGSWGKDRAEEEAIPKFFGGGGKICEDGFIVHFRSIHSGIDPRHPISERAE